MQAALHQQFTLRLADHLDRLGGRRVAVRHIDDLRAVKVERMGLGNITDFVLWTHEDLAGRRPSSAASSAPLSDVSSQGCTTAVANGVCFLAVVIKRSYFSCCRAEHHSGDDTLLQRWCDGQPRRLETGAQVSELRVESLELAAHLAER